VDTVLLVGSKEEKLKNFLLKMGYDVVEPAKDVPLPECVARQPVDLVVLDSRLGDCVALCEYLRADAVTREVPIVLLAEDAARLAIGEHNIERLEVVPLPASPGLLVGRIAMNLRLRKMAGSEDQTHASIGEINAALRDLNARFKKERDEARSIQLSLLPTALPKNNDFAIAASYQPLEEVGGDWYYVQNEPSGAQSIIIADVTGHGLSAAFIGSMTKLAMCAAGREDPAERLCHMNRLMAPQLPEGRFVTMGAVLYDPKTGVLQSARAGHPPVLVLHRAENRVAKLTPDGFALGFLPDSKYVLQSDKLAVGDVAVLVTDGITEGQNMSSENYGFERLSAALAATAPADSPEKIVEALLSDFDKFRDGRILKDDVTLVVLKRHR
jgi:serine phosphatase RsbU (regulator of sigma subunit)